MTREKEGFEGCVGWALGSWVCSFRILGRGGSRDEAQCAVSGHPISIDASCILIWASPLGRHDH